MTFTAGVDRGEAVLEFPYDERLRGLLRAIPGRRWDPGRRAWCLALGPESARSLSMLLAGLPAGAVVSDDLARELRRMQIRRRPGACLLDLARPDADWWVCVASDAPAWVLARLHGHPHARTVEPIGSSLVPLDGRSVAIVEDLRSHGAGVELSAALSAAVGRHAEREEDREARPEHDVGFRRDRGGEHWIVVGERLAPLARVLAARAGLGTRTVLGGALGLRASEADARAIAELLVSLDDASVEPRVRAWLERALRWRGTVDVAGSLQQPVFLLGGDEDRLPAALRDRGRREGDALAVPLTRESLAEIERLGGWMSDAARVCARALREDRPPPPAVLRHLEDDGGPAFALEPGHDTDCISLFARIDGALAPSGRRAGGLWRIRADPFCVRALDAFLDARGVWIEPAALALLQEVREEHARREGLVALSAAHDAPLEVARLQGELKPFQRAGVAYALERRRAFLADEQGLGKTIQALAALEADDAYPAAVVCPASLKLNWLREIERWLPHRSTRALTGRSAGAGGTADITVLNYEIAGARGEELRRRGLRALVIDESHYCKNARAKRTQAVAELAGGVADDGLVLALTGTPVVNRPAELIPQLRILGRLADFGSGAKFGERFRGADAHVRLHWHLRARCLVRRLKIDVLPQLPEKTRAVVPIELDNEPEYRLAERDVVAWLQSQPLDLRELDARVAAALRAERLVRLNALKLLAARGKLRGALAWLHDFCSSGERLVVFAHHREVQQRLLEHFGDALHILGSDSPAARDRALRAFQEEDGHRLIVCSIDVAGQGLTLTRASNVAFLELDWTPAKHDQAEDRCHRIGQHDAVNAYYLLAAQTVDETIASLLERKRAVIGAVTDGVQDEDAGVAEALVRELRGAPFRHLRAVA
ncbi:MAG TPA: DEAD/DEAH box helicase [Solirubrobacteraceae bacterium]|nr:DEAD/DEAH box helicase [Solirubrobacteraceae bacterium]